MAAKLPRTSRRGRQSLARHLSAPPAHKPRARYLTAGGISTYEGNFRRNQLLKKKVLVPPTAEPES